jgi:hypothetical protein
MQHLLFKVDAALVIAGHLLAFGIAPAQANFVLPR